MDWLIIIALAVVAALFLIVFLGNQNDSKNGAQSYGSRKRRQYPPDSTAILFDLHIGDVVQYFDEDWIVEGKMTYNDDGFVWMEYLLQLGDRIAFLAVEEDDILETAILDPVKDLDISGEPPQQLTYQGNEYRLEEASTATMTRLTSTGQRTAETCNYYDYEGPDGLVLSIEEWGGQREITAGKSVPPRSLTILPGDGESVYR